MGEKWFEFVKRIQSDEKKKGKDMSFKEAMSVASNRKSEWKKDGADHSKSHTKKAKKGGKKRRGGTKKQRKSKSRSRK
jgi:hypothetical protein